MLRWRFLRSRTHSTGFSARLAMRHVLCRMYPIANMFCQAGVIPDLLAALVGFCNEQNFIHAIYQSTSLVAVSAWLIYPLSSRSDRAMRCEMKQLEAFEREP
jgi:hypothetical protein